MGERRIIRLDELNRSVRLHRRTNHLVGHDSLKESSRRMMRLSSVFIQDELNDLKTHYKSVV